MNNEEIIDSIKIKKVQREMLLRQKYEVAKRLKHIEEQINDVETAMKQLADLPWKRDKECLMKQN